MKETSTSKSNGDYFQLKLRRYPTSSTSDLCEFRMSLFYHGESEEFFLFMRNFQMTLVALVTLKTESNTQYFCTLVRGEALPSFDLVSADAKST